MKTNEDGFSSYSCAASLLQNIDINYSILLKKRKSKEPRKKYGDAASSLATNLQIGLRISTSLEERLA
jgi:hypothetical protein